jgi:hypothetical protein
MHKLRNIQHCNFLERQMPNFSFASTFKNEYGDASVAPTKMNFKMNGTSDDILRRMTDEQIVEGIRRAEAGIAIAKLSLDNPDDMWDSDHMDGPFPGTRAGEVMLQNLDSELHRKYTLALSMLCGEQHRRASKCR